MSSDDCFPRIKVATSEDVEIIARNNIALAKETEDVDLVPELTLTGVKTCISRPDLGPYYLVEVPEGIVAQLRVDYVWLPFNGRYSVWIHSIYVHPNHRGKGYCRLLYSHVKAEAQKLGAASIRLYADRRNEKAKQIYCKFGMKEIDDVYV